MSAHTKADTHPPQASTGEGKLTVVTETIVKEYIWPAWGRDEVACASCQWEFSVDPNTCGSDDHKVHALRTHGQRYLCGRLGGDHTL